MDFYAIGAPEVVRLYLATVGTSSDRHMLVIGLDATDPAELERLTGRSPHRSSQAFVCLR